MENMGFIEFIDEIKLDIDRLGDLSQVLADIVLESSDTERVDKYYSLARTISHDLRTLSNSIERRKEKSSTTLN